MTVGVVKKNEIYLNNVYYPILNQVRPALISNFPSKIVIGDYTQADEQVASSWIINDQRGGILIEEMDETIHLDRCYWSTCELGYKGHIVLGPLATDCGDSKYTSATAWAASTAYTAGDAIKPSTYNGYWYECTDAGTSASGEPTWGTTEDGTTSDGGVEWTCRKGDAFFLFDFEDEVYGIFDRFCQKLDNTNDDFEDSEKEFEADPTDVLVYKDCALVAFGDDANIQQHGLPPLDKYIDNPYFKNWTSGYPDDWGFELPSDGAVTQNNDTDYINKGKFSVKLEAGATERSYMRQKLPFSNVLRSKTITITAYVATDDADDEGDTKIRIKDGVGSSATTIGAAGATSLQQVTVVRAMNASATTLELEFEVDDTYWLYIDHVEISIAGFTDWVDMGTKGAYMTALGDYLYMVDVDGDFYRSKVGIEWVWKAEIPIEFGSVTSCSVYRDAYGNMIPYVGTDIGEFAYDEDNEELVQTDLSLPSHPTAAKHPGMWQGGHYVPAGLDVLRYVAGTIASITSVGLDREAGLPAEYEGEITGLWPSYNDIFATVDSTYGGGSSKSALMAFNGSGWQAKWVSSTANKAMKCALVSSAHDEYRVFWGADNKVYHMTLQRNLRNPLKVPSFPFAASGIHITPWFDAGTIMDKLAIELELFCKGIVDDNEEVVVKYRIDHSNTDLETGWTTLDTIESDGENTLSFGSSAGIVFKDIQFRFELSRRAGDNTKTPDIQKVKLKYLKLLPAAWGWTVDVDCTKKYRGNSSAQLVEKLVTATETQTLLTFAYSVDSSKDPETHYVKIARIPGMQESGLNKSGKYTLNLIEV